MLSASVSAAKGMRMVGHWMAYLADVLGFCDFLADDGALVSATTHTELSVPSQKPGHTVPVGGGASFPLAWQMAVLPRM